MFYMIINTYNEPKSIIYKPILKFRLENRMNRVNGYFNVHM